MKDKTSVHVVKKGKPLSEVKSSPQKVVVQSLGRGRFQTPNGA